MAIRANPQPSISYFQYANPTGIAPFRKSNSKATTPQIRPPARKTLAVPGFLSPYWRISFFRIPRPIQTEKGSEPQKKDMRNQTRTSVQFMDWRPLDRY